MQHAFFANMGGYILETPDFPAFPIRSDQLFYLVSNNFLDYPKENKADLDDKTKRDNLVRYVDNILTVCKIDLYPSGLSQLFKVSFSLSAAQPG